MTACGVTRGKKDKMTEKGFAGAGARTCISARLSGWTFMNCSPFGLRRCIEDDAWGSSVTVWGPEDIVSKVREGEEGGRKERWRTRSQRRGRESSLIKGAREAEHWYGRLTIWSIVVYDVPTPRVARGRGAVLCVHVERTQRNSLRFSS